MSCFSTDPNDHWLFFFAHPDDEIAIAGWIHHLVNSGIKISCAWAHSTPVRKSESLNAMKVLGVKSENLSFESFPDGDFIDDLESLGKWVTAILAKESPTKVVTGAFEQGHLDHDSLNFAVYSSWGEDFMEFPLYHSYNKILQTINAFSDPSSGENWEIPPNGQVAKRALIDCFPSQTVARNIRWYEVISAVKRKPSTLHQTERLRLHQLGPEGYCAPNAPRSLAEKIKRTKEWKRWARTFPPK